MSDRDGCDQILSVADFVFPDIVCCVAEMDFLQVEKNV